MEASAKQILDTLSSLDSIRSKSNLRKLDSEISHYVQFYPEPASIQNYNVSSEKIDDFIYGKIVERLLDLVSTNPIMQDETKSLQQFINKIMVVDTSTFLMLHELLVICTDWLKRPNNDQSLNLITSTLESIIKSDAIYSALIDATQSNDTNSIRQEEFIQKWREFIQILVSLPNRLANKTKGQIGASFSLDSYAKIMSYHVLRAVLFLNKITNELAIKPNVNVITLFISKLILILRGDTLVDFVEIIIEWSLRNTANLQTFIEKNILAQIERSSIEPMAVLLLRLTKNAHDISKVFGNLLDTPQWRHVLLKKIPFLSYYKDQNLIVNLIGYLAGSQHKDQVLPDLLIKLLDIWGDRSALNHTSLDQHEYITKLILLSAKYLKLKLSQSECEKIQQLLFSGTSTHLESLQVEIRAIGMITSELVVKILNTTDGAPKLIYDYESMPVTGRKLIDTLSDFFENTENHSSKIPPSYSEGNEDLNLYELSVKCGIVSRSTVDNKTKVIEENHHVTNDENIPLTSCPEAHDSDDLDSDDDLEPYDMSNDTKISNKLRPMYLRDLKDNIVTFEASKDPNIFSESLEIAEELIVTQLPHDDSSFAVELLNIFTALSDIAYVEDFERLKFNACVAIVTVYPKECAGSLCQKFHADISQYSSHDRIFFLDVLAEAARKLSKVEFKPEIEKDNQSKISKSKPNNKPISLFVNVSEGKKHETLYDDDFEVSNNAIVESNWQEIVQKRVQSNTRRFAHQTKPLQTTINKFNDVVSSFFYPLLYGMSQKGTYLHKIPDSYVDQEHLLLERFLDTLSIIMVAAENCVIAPKMGLDILELAWSLRYHVQSKIRYCVIKNIASVVVTLPKDNLSPEIYQLLIEFRAWLSDVSQDSVRGDPDENCRALGKNVAALIHSMISSE